ncbi:hypothetical protein DP939_22070 [Spongiactinospora rosea]|uniref:Uncharacterized protein n=1 Tax=Spongiactinospora rosea TaxID=2248750 RepID=A0A366LXM1_9ACTN|nr:hypothetical protein DP939_22070 [Spongiactinospora rosea]
MPPSLPRFRSLRVALFLVLRYAPDGIVRLLAGVVAVLAKDKERGRRALALPTSRMRQARRAAS